MKDDELMSGVISRLLAKRPDLWAVFQTDPLGALEDAKITPTEAERQAILRTEQAVAAHASKREATPDPLTEAFKADLAAARAARAIDYNPFAMPLDDDTPPTAVDESLLAEQKRLRDRAAAMRAQLAEEKKRLAEERDRAFRKLGKKPE
jgi:hypothetical protein